MDRSQPYTMLARLVATLSEIKPVSVPFAMGARNTEWSETFRVDKDRITNEIAVVHEMWTRRTGVARMQSSESCFWSLGEMLDQMVEWNDEDFAAVEAMLIPYTSGMSDLLDSLASLDHRPEGTHIICYGAGWTSGRKDGKSTLTIDEGRDHKWTLDEAVMAVIRGN